MVEDVMNDRQAVTNNAPVKTPRCFNRPGKPADEVSHFICKQNLRTDTFSERQ